MSACSSWVMSDTCVVNVTTGVYLYTSVCVRFMHPDVGSLLSFLHVCITVVELMQTSTTILLTNAPIGLV